MLLATTLSKAISLEARAKAIRVRHARDNPIE